MLDFRQVSAIVHHRRKISTAISKWAESPNSRVTPRVLVDSAPQLSQTLCTCFPGSRAASYFAWERLMPPSSNVLSFVPVPTSEHGQRRNSATPPKPAVIEDEAVLRKIAEAALSATAADGAALALRRDGAVICVARAGEMAPPLGARLDDTSGMSGECLREGQPLRCDDTETDTRVDAEACRDLGLRSLAVAAIQLDGNIIGILEVFSPQPSTFTERHMEVLRQLAELVVADSAAETSEVESPPSAKSPPETQSTLIVPQPRLLPAKIQEETPAQTSAALAAATPPLTTTRSAVAATPLPSDVNISAYMAAHEKAKSQATTGIPKIVLIGLAVVVVTASSVGWYFRHWVPSGTSAVATAPPPVPDVSSAPPAPIETSAIVPTETKLSPDAASTPGGTQAATKSAANSLTKASSKSRIASDSTSVTSPLRVVQSPPADDANTDVPPGLPSAGEGTKSSDAVRVLLNTPASLPVRAAPISQGVEGGELETQVGAIYPPQARQMGQHGTVVLEALVGPDGSVKDVKVVSGPPLLRQAAIDSVRRWKYHPFRLNGKKVSAQTQVEVEFKLQ
jgi:TonB family protein